MHVFLTGEIQIGKSTVLQKTRELLGVPYGGFCTYFGNDRVMPDRCLYMGDASKAPSFNEINAVVRFRTGSSPQALTERFDQLGTSLIKAAREKAQLIVMDELGNFERDALIFQRAVMEALSGSIPVLGVLKKTATGWTDDIRRNPNIRIIETTAANRDNLPMMLSKDIKSMVQNYARLKK